MNTTFKGIIYDRYFKLFFKFKPALEDFINSYFEFVNETKRFGFADIAYQALIEPDNFKARDMFADIRCTLDDGEVILLEAFNDFAKEEYNKSYSYSCRTFANQLKYLSKKTYKDMKPVRCLNFIHHNYAWMNNDIINNYLPMNTVTKKIIDTSHVEMVLIRLDKVEKYLIQSKHEERFIRWLKLLNAKTFKEMEKIGKDDVIMEQSIEFLKCYRKEYDSFEEEMKERELRGISLGEQRGKKDGIKQTQLETGQKLTKTWHRYRDYY